MFFDSYAEISLLSEINRVFNMIDNGSDHVNQMLDYVCQVSTKSRVNNINHDNFIFFS